MASACAVLVGLSVQDVRTHNPVSTSVRFNREIAPILYTRCAPCHADKGLAMPLQTYRQVRPWAVAIKEEVLARHMPPWPAEPGYGAFANDGGLTPREREFLLSWVDGGVPEGDEEPPPFHDHSGHWMLGTADRVYTSVPAGDRHHEAAHGDSGTVRTSRFIIDTGARDELRIRAFDLQMRDRSATRAAFVSVEQSGQYLGGWTPWHSSAELPPGLAFRLPAGTRIAIDVVHNASTATIEPPRLAVYAGDARAAAIERPLMLTGELAGGTRRVRAQQSLDSALTLIGFRIDMDGATSIELNAQRPDGTRETLLWQRRVRPEWPVPYLLREPVVLPAGSVLRATAYFDEASLAPRVTVHLTGVESQQHEHHPGPPLTAPSHEH
jgi:hypothetical protein